MKTNDERETEAASRCSAWLGCCIDRWCEWFQLCLRESCLVLRLKLKDFHIALLEKGLQLRDSGFKPGKVLLFWRRCLEHLNLPYLIFVGLFVTLHKWCAVEQPKPKLSDSDEIAVRSSGSVGK